MTSDQFARVKELVLAVADLSAPERAAYLDEACRNDPVLRRDVESMLAHEEESPDILKTGRALPGLPESAHETIAPHHADVDVPAESPREIAGYRILGKLGEGGMGVVYEAEQQNPRRAVALKVVRGGAYVDEHHVRLFQREAQTLARLEHPSIAAIYEAGRTDEGQHFFAMELVRGVTLDAYLDEYPIAHARGSAVRMELRARLALFQQICAAVAYAHQRGVIHRDLKPSNILVVTGSGARDGGTAGEEASGDAGSSADRRPGTGSTSAIAQVKILDFGLARITDTDVAMTTMISEVGSIQGTLPYMSPEQARGNPAEIDLRSDVYALGVILYEMLTGERPYDVEKSLVHEALRVICEEEPRRPSTVVRTLRGDVETIALKALEKDPEQRYQTAQALAEDIERYLVDEPILARPPSTIYQLRKLVARHRVPFAFAAAIFALLIAFGITMTSMYGAQRREHRRAEHNLVRASAEAEKATQINQFLQDMLSSVDPEYAQGRELTVREILDEAAERIETSLADQPEVRAAIGTTIGRTYRGLGYPDKAEQYLQTAAEILRSLPDANPENLVYCLNNLAWTVHGRHDYVAYASLIDEALAVGRERLGEKHRLTARTIYMQGDLLRHTEDLDGSEASFRQALALQREIFGEAHREIASTLNDIGLVFYGRGDYENAERFYKQALEMNRQLRGERSHAVVLQHMNLGNMLIKKGDHARSEFHLLEALSIRAEIFGDKHPSFADVLRYLGWLHVERGDLTEGEMYYRECLEIQRSWYGEDREQIAFTLTGLGTTLGLQGDHDAADRVLTEALEMRRRLVGDVHLDVAKSLDKLSGNDQSFGHRDAARSYLEEALAIRRELLGPDHADVLHTLRQIALQNHIGGNYGAALTAYNEILEQLRRQHAGEDRIPVADMLNMLGYLHQVMGNDAAAEPCFREALAMRERLLSSDHKNVTSTLTGLGGTLIALGRPVEADSLLRRALLIREVRYPPDHHHHYEVAVTRSELGAGLTARGRCEEAEELLLDAHTILEPSEAPVGRKRRCLGYLIDLYETWGKPDRAVEYERRLRLLEEPDADG